MLYQLPSGRAIELSLDQYLDMSDAELDYLNANYHGDSVENPWYGSMLSKSGKGDILEKEIDEEEFILEDLTTISIEEKYFNPDIDIPFIED